MQQKGHIPFWTTFWGPHARAHWGQRQKSNEFKIYLCTVVYFLLTHLHPSLYPIQTSKRHYLSSVGYERARERFGGPYLVSGPDFPQHWVKSERLCSTRFPVCVLTCRHKHLMCLGFRKSIIYPLLFICYLIAATYFSIDHSDSGGGMFYSKHKPAA